jgi:hypothetical protein
MPFSEIVPLVLTAVLASIPVALRPPLHLQRPSFPPLAGDEGLASFPLGVEGVEILLEPFLRGLPSYRRRTN